VVSGGCGIGSDENFRILGPLAGKAVAPRRYIVVGIPERSCTWQA
jgi:electron transfer flavoprotein alpha subunit